MDDIGKDIGTARELQIDRDENGVVRLTLNRPASFNALSDSLLDALQAQIDALREDGSARVVILAGAGRAFCAGHDLREMIADPGEEKMRALFRKCSAVMLGLQRLKMPVIARVHGAAVAAGCQLVAACDLAIAARSARFAVSGINLGLFCSTPSVALARAMPRKPALEMLFTGDMIDAEEAARRFLINRAVEDDALDAEIDRIAGMILAKPADALAIGKAQFYQHIEQDVASAYETATEAMACNMASPSARDGIAAFLEGRHKR